jgi:hypothetical protein
MIMIHRIKYGVVCHIAEETKIKERRKWVNR